MLTDAEKEMASRLLSAAIGVKWESIPASEAAKFLLGYETGLNAGRSEAATTDNAIAADTVAVPATQSHTDSGVGGMPRLLRISEVVERVGLSRTCVYDLIASGDFPAQRQISRRRVAWLESDIESWLRNRTPGGREPGDGNAVLPVHNLHRPHYGQEKPGKAATA